MVHFLLLVLLLFFLPLGQKRKYSKSIPLVKSVFPRTKQLFEERQRREKEEEKQEEMR